MSTILTGHTLDLAIYLLGGIVELNAMTAIKYGQVKLTDAPGYVERTTPDYLAVHAGSRVAALCPQRSMEVVPVTHHLSFRLLEPRVD